MNVIGSKASKGSKAPKVAKGGWARNHLPIVLVVATLGSFGSFVPFDAFDPSASQPKTPERLISLVPPLTEMVFAVGGGDKVIAVSSYDDYPPQVKSLPRVGALLDPDVERIITLKPDLVLVYGSQSDLMAQLARANIPYFSYRHGGLASVTATIRALGERIGLSGRAESVAAEIERRLTALRQRTAGLKKPRTLLVFGRERGSLRNIYASGGRGFLHDMLEAAGGVNVFADIQAESVQASSELILTRAPEAIIEIRSVEIPDPSDLGKEIDSWRVLASLPAVRNGRIFLVTGKDFSIPGPRVADNAEEFARLLHGALK